MEARANQIEYFRVRLNKFVVYNEDYGYGKGNEWERFKDEIRKSGLPVKDIIAHLNAIRIKSNNYSVERYAEILSNTAELCGDLNELIDHTLPEYFANRATYPAMLKSIAVKFFNERLTADDFFKVIMQKFNDDTLARQFLKLGPWLFPRSTNWLFDSRTSGYDNVIFEFYSQLGKLSENANESDLLTILCYHNQIVENYDPRLQYSNYRHSNFRAQKEDEVIIAIMLQLSSNKNNATVIFDSLQKRIGQIGLIQANNFTLYTKFAKLLENLKQGGIPANTILSLFANIDVIICAKSHFGGVYWNKIDLTDYVFKNHFKHFGGFFYMLAKNGILPTFKYSNEMRAEIMNHILTLANQEKSAALQKIKNNNDASLCSIFWEERRDRIFFTKIHLPRKWQEIITSELSNSKVEKPTSPSATPHSTASADQQNISPVYLSTNEFNKLFSSAPSVNQAKPAAADDEHTEDKPLMEYGQ